MLDVAHSQADVKTEFGVVLLDSVGLSVIASIKWYLGYFKFLETAKDGLLLLSDILLCIVYCSKGYFLKTVIILQLHKWETTVQHGFGSRRNVTGFAVTYSETDNLKLNDASAYRNTIFLWLKTETLSTSSHRRLETFFSHSFLRLLLTVTDPFLNFILTLLTLLTYVWTIRLSYLALCTLCNSFRPQARAFRVWSTTRFHQLCHHLARHFPRPASQQNPDSATQPESIELRPVPRSARAPVVESQVAETQPLI